jgi:hypothetical protein
MLSTVHASPPPPSYRERVWVLADFSSFTLNRFLSVKNFASQGPGKYDPDGRFFPTDVLSSRTFCPPDVLSNGPFVPTDLLSDGRFVATDILSPRTFCPYGRFVHG